MLFTQDHEFIDYRDGIATVGISDHAQAQLGDLVFVDLPKIGLTLKKGESAAVVESVKAASDVYAPVSGEVVEVNVALQDKPHLINEDATGAGWIFKLRLADEKDLEGLMDAAAYSDYVKTVS